MLLDAFGLHIATTPKNGPHGLPQYARLVLETISLKYFAMMFSPFEIVTIMLSSHLDMFEIG